jgi:uncharacterized protein YndB with AHSA1/START domain
VSALADLKDGVIHASIEIEAPPDAVFEAFTDPAQLAAWWGSPDTYSTTNWQVDLRPGGAWSSEPKSAADGSLSRVHGQYLEVDRPRLLVFTWQPSWENFHETVIRIEFSPTATGTHVKVVHSGFGERGVPAGSSAEGWKRVLGWLADHAALR